MVVMVMMVIHKEFMKPSSPQVGGSRMMMLSQM